VRWISVYPLAAKIELLTPLFGWEVNDLGDSGDRIVLEIDECQHFTGGCLITLDFYGDRYLFLLTVSRLYRSHLETRRCSSRREQLGQMVG
jgi:hypothetical protein